MEDNILIKCKTILDNTTIKALARYHFVHKKDVKKKRILTLSFGIILLILSIINAYGYWLKYYGTASVLIILLKSSVLFLFSFIILYTGIKGSEHNLYRELKQYFQKTETRYIDYIISETGIQMNINDHSTTYTWKNINHMESDEQFYYFSSDGKHSLIAKNDLSQKEISTIDSLIQNIVIS